MVTPYCQFLGAHRQSLAVSAIALRTLKDFVSIAGLAGIKPQ
jgi:hypothetical protein